MVISAVLLMGLAKLPTRGGDCELHSDSRTLSLVMWLSVSTWSSDPPLHLQPAAPLTRLMRISNSKGLSQTGVSKQRLSPEIGAFMG